MRHLTGIFGSSLALKIQICREAFIWKAWPKFRAKFNSYKTTQKSFRKKGSTDAFSCAVSARHSK